MRRLTILLAAMGALLLVPAAQAFANEPVKVNIEGIKGGSGEVLSAELPLGGGGEFYLGTPPIECSGPPATGVCENEMTDHGEGYEADFLEEIPAPGSEFVEFVIEEGASEGCGFYAGTHGGVACVVYSEPPGSGGAKLTAVFRKIPSGGPTNRRTLTITKEAGGPGPVGTVSSKPKGINCATACDKAVAQMYKNTPVTLKEKPATGDTFLEWTGACSGSAETCTVPMVEAEEVGAVFSGSSKAITNPQPLTLSKGEGSGYGTVKAAGLACEAECSEETVLYQGPIALPKPKPGKTVELKETPAYGSEFSGWSGACSGTEAVCKVTMEEAESVTAEFAAKPKTTLTIEKNSYETGTGTVSSKPKGLNCATACTTQTMSVPSGESIVLKEKPATGMTFAGWSGGGCSGTAETCTVPVSAATTVKATFSGAPKAIVNPQVLTLNKAGSGFGTVKAAGLACETECTTTQVLFQGPITLPKPKPGKTVLLKATSAPGSQQVAWTGCESEPTPAECVVVMEEAKEVVATFEELE